MAAGGCYGTDTIRVTNHSKTINAGNDTSVCQNQQIQIQGSGATTFSWTPTTGLSNPNIANPVVNAGSANLTYYLTGKDLNNCDDTDSVKIIIRSQQQFSINPPASICKDKSVQLTAAGGNLYVWHASPYLSNLNSATPVASPINTTTFTVDIADTICHLTSSMSTTITVLPLPVINATKVNNITCSIDNSQLMATGGINYTWTPSVSLNNAAIANPVASPAISTLYTVTGIDTSGCTNTDTVTVNVNKLSASIMYLPNAFTPNGDGKNDCFGIKNWSISNGMEFSIFNRYGERVFYTTDPAKCWNGLYKTDKPLPGNYVYFIKAKTACGTVEKKGNVLLLK